MKHTETFEVNYNHFCFYCLKEAKEEKETYYHDTTYSYYCDCENAKKELVIQDKQLHLELELRNLKQKCIHGDKLEEFKLMKQLEWVRKRLK